MQGSSGDWASTNDAARAGSRWGKLPMPVGTADGNVNRTISTPPGRYRERLNRSNSLYGGHFHPT